MNLLYNKIKTIASPINILYNIFKKILELFLMDTFFEQIVSMKKNGKNIALLILIWLVAIFLAAVCFYFTLFFPILILAVLGIFYGAFKLSIMQNIEYEYILTNGEIDIDKITAKNSRKRMLTFACKDIQRIEKFNPAAPPVINDAKMEIYCNTDDENACFVLINHSKRGKVIVVFAPDAHIKQGMSGSIPRIIAGDFFKK